MEIRSWLSRKLRTSSVQAGVNARGTASAAICIRARTVSGSGKCTWRPRTTRSLPTGSWSKDMIVCRRKTSRRREATPATSRMRRPPSAERSSWTMTSTAELIWSRSASKGTATSDMDASVCRRVMASSAEFACTVVSEPS